MCIEMFQSACNKHAEVKNGDVLESIPFINDRL